MNNKTKTSTGIGIGLAVGSVLYVLTDEAVWIAIGAAIGTGSAQLRGRK